MRAWKCVNCGHEVAITENLDGLLFEQYSNRTSKAGCKACGSYTINQAYDDSFTAGNFLIVKTKPKTQGKGRC